MEPRAQPHVIRRECRAHYCTHSDLYVEYSSHDCSLSGRGTKDPPAPCSRATFSALFPHGLPSVTSLPTISFPVSRPQVLAEAKLGGVGGVQQHPHRARAYSTEDVETAR